MKLVIRGLNKSYGSKAALQDFHAVFENGIYGILGPNGAGKSTLMNILTDNLLRDSGRILCNEKEITKMKEQYRKIMGYMPQQQQLYDSFTVNHFISYMGTLRGMNKKEIKRRMEELLPLLNLNEVRRKKIKELSGGMKQRVLLLQALLDDPKILILDEPTAGLDPKERIRIRNLISDLSGDKIVLIATHVVSDIEFISKEILLMKNGRVVDKDCPEALQKKIAGKVFEIRIVQEELNQVKKEFEISNLFRTEGEIVVRVISEECPTAYRWTEVSPTLEDVYLYEFECTSKED
ncbi:MAG: ATP-binding cassette domain-containing protein [Faecalimonas sp.]|nr:ATP-binding cassette domain-containing protein [Faecalimonas sp.]